MFYEEHTFAYTRTHKIVEYTQQLRNAHHNSTAQLPAVVMMQRTPSGELTPWESPRGSMYDVMQ